MAAEERALSTLTRQLYKNGSSGKSILRDYFQENMISQRPFLLLRISFPEKPIFIQLVPDEVWHDVVCAAHGAAGVEEEDAEGDDRILRLLRQRHLRHIQHQN